MSETARGSRYTTEITSTLISRGGQWRYATELDYRRAVEYGAIPEHQAVMLILGLRPVYDLSDSHQYSPALRDVLKALRDTAAFKSLGFMGVRTIPEVFALAIAAGVEPPIAFLQSAANFVSEGTKTDLAVRRDRSKQASATAKLRYAKDKDGRQQAKAHVLELWQAWQQSPHLYASASAFARDMLDKFEVLGSQQVVERWAREWRKG